MKKKLFRYFSKVATILAISSMLFVYQHAYATNATFQVGLIVSGCNNNSICESNLGEDKISCPSDCSGTQPSIPTPTISVPSTSYRVGSYQTTIPNQTIHFYVFVTPTSATIKWQTASAVVASLSWGQHPDQELGIVNEVQFNKSHEIKIDNLLPDTKYYFTVAMNDQAGNMFRLPDQYFTTLKLFDTFTPTNVSNFSATPVSDTLFLQWKNPSSSDYREVVILRSPYRYPRTPSDGRIVYEGSGTYVYDTSVQKDKKYFYTAFSYDKSGVYSSGALVSSTLTAPSFVPNDPFIVEPTIASTTSFTTADIRIIQNKKFIQPAEGFYKIDNTSQITLFLLPNKVQQTVDSVVLSIENEKLPPSRYFFKKNDTSGIYETTILPIKEAGDHRFTIEERANNDTVISRIKSTFRSTHFEPKKLGFIDQFKLPFLALSLGLLLLILALFIHMF